MTLLVLSSCHGQTQDQRTKVSDDFDKTPPIYYGMPDDVDWKDTSPGWDQKGEKILITGTVYQLDGKTPAAAILLYYYQTDIHGRYVDKVAIERSMPPNKLGQTHGYIRGWVKTDETGKYAIYTVRPESYPSRDEPAHIHIYVKEPNLDVGYSDCSLLLGIYLFEIAGV